MGVKDCAQIEGRDELDTRHSYDYESVLASALPGRNHGRIPRRFGLIELDWFTLYIRLYDRPSFEFEFYAVEDICRTPSFINERFFGHESRCLSYQWDCSDQVCDLVSNTLPPPLCGHLRIDHTAL